MEHEVHIYDMLTINFSPIGLWLAALPISGLAVAVFMVAYSFLSGRRSLQPWQYAGMSTWGEELSVGYDLIKSGRLLRTLADVAISLTVAAIVICLLIIASSPVFTVITAVAVIAVFVAGRRGVYADYANKREGKRRVPAWAFHALAASSFIMTLALPVALSATVSYMMIKGVWYFDQAAAGGSIAERIMSSPEVTPLSADELQEVDREVLWYAADIRQGYRDLWRFGAMDLGRFAWDHFGDGDVDEHERRGKVWNVVRVKPAMIIQGDVNSLPIWCEYEDLELVRSNFVIRSKVSLGDNPVTAPLHALCPARFEPGNAPLQDPTRIFD